ncbi:[protein-PII] uridylyltransferase [Aliikangiella sp. IMCC44653]
MKSNSRTTSVNKKLSAILDFESQSISREELLEKLKRYFQLLEEHLNSEFKKGTNVRSLVHSRTRYVDKLLVTLWHYYGINNHAALIAVGGYGRGELHPQSDIDMLILSETTLDPHYQQPLESIISLLWDCHLKVGQSVRSFEQCIDLAKQDLTVATNIMEARYLCGDKAMFNKLRAATSPSHIWPAQDFYHAKIAEQRARYKKFDGSSFDLEPNIKSSPGGLRDIHLISWIAQRTYFPKSLYQLIKQNLISKKEYYTLVKCQLYIWRVRYALHIVSGKPEDRLLFDYQKNTAKLMGFKDSKNALGVEKMMKRYYRSALIIRNICDILIQVLEENLHRTDQPEIVAPIDEHFQIVNQRIDAIDPKLFVKKPSQLLKIFQYVAKDNEIKGITASTLRAIRAARHKITPSFRNKNNNKQLFVEFWHILHTSPRAMFQMKRSGVLADYLNAFKQITGQMQYDMFHNYTVDEHTLFLLKNLSEFADPENNQAFPLCSEIMQRQKHPEIIFLAGLFHDIAKGRGGDHSELGAMEARNFCISHSIDPKHTAIIEWLVANHLVMSMVAQKRDISDPKVIKNFAEIVENQMRLELLYILTVADIRATSHSLWNSWKDSLLKNLYLNTSAYLNQDNSSSAEVWQVNRTQAKKLLNKQGFDNKKIDALWQYLDSQYFSKRSASSIAWQSKLILEQQGEDNNRIVIGIKTTPQKSGSEIFVYSKDKDHLFAALTATLSQLGLSILAANIYTDQSGHCYDSFFVLDEKGNLLKNSQLKNTIKHAIIENIGQTEDMELSVQRRMPRQLKYFSIDTKVEFFDDEYTGFTRLELTARDQPGLLAAVGKAFVKANIRLHEARVTTLGEKVEDTFIVSQKDNTPISDQNSREEIIQEIKRQLDK